MLLFFCPDGTTNNNYTLHLQTVEVSISSLKKLPLCAADKNAW